MSVSDSPRHVVEEGLARVIVDAVLRIQQAHRGRRDHRLLDRHGRDPAGLREVAISVRRVAKRPACDAWQLASVAVFERDDDAVRRESLEPRDRVGDEARLGLLAVPDHGRAGGLEALDRVAKRRVVALVELRLRDAAFAKRRDRLNQLWRPRDAPDRLGLDGHDGGVYGAEVTDGSQRAARLAGAVQAIRSGGPVERGARPLEARRRVHERLEQPGLRRPPDEALRMPLHGHREVPLGVLETLDRPVAGPRAGGRGCAQ